MEEEIRTILNKNSAENESDTPDYILAGSLLEALEAFNKAVRYRDAWQGGVKIKHVKLG